MSILIRLWLNMTKQFFTCFRILKILHIWRLLMTISFHQIVVTCPWVLKMVVYRIHSYAPLPSITTTVDRLTQGSTDGGTGGREGPGAQRNETDVSGCRWILARFRQCQASLLREDRTQLNGLRVIMYPTVEMATSSLLTGKAGVHGWGLLLVCFICFIYLPHNNRNYVEKNGEET